MPSEKKNKRQKADQKPTTSTEPLKPLAHYVGDRLELTKQLFSCLKNKQIKQRLPPNLQNKSIERIQQICLDEILGISTKRLVSIINNTRCPENTDSDDSEIEQVDEHISLEEISSDSEVEATVQKAKKTESTSKATKNQKKTPKEMTMLELLELQARARAIRSQLALEPVTKIELDSDDDEEEAKETKNGKEASTPSNDINKEKEMRPAEKQKSVEKASEKKSTNDQSVRRILPPPPPPKQTPVQTPVISAKPVKLKRNYKSQISDGASTSSVAVQKEPTPPKTVISTDNKEDTANEDDDVINMDPSPETFFISDSEDDEPLAKKSPTTERKDEIPEQAASDPKENRQKEEPKEQVEQQEEGELSAKASRENSPEIEKCESLKSSPAPALEPVHSNDNAMNDEDDDVMHLMSDTEIELHHHSDKEDEEVDSSPKKKQKTVTEPLKELLPPVNPPDNDCEDDIVEINNSSDDDLMNESDKSAGESAKNSQTWEDRWLSSSKTQNILKTTQLASKVRGKILKTKKNLKANEKKKAENDKVMKEKVSSLEEGSMEQFKDHST